MQACNFTGINFIYILIIFRNIFICVEESSYMKYYMKIKITKIACKFFRTFSKNYQKKETPSAKHIWQSPYLPRFYVISKLQA